MYADHIGWANVIGE